MIQYCSFCGEKLTKQVYRCPFCRSLLSQSGEIPVQGQADAADKTDDTDKAGDINDVTTMSNGWKVFVAAIYTLIPGFGQIAGIITSLSYMNSESDDIKSYGKALFRACIIIFPISVSLMALLGILFKYVYNMK